MMSDMYNPRGLGLPRPHRGRPYRSKTALLDGRTGRIQLSLGAHVHADIAAVTPYLHCFMYTIGSVVLNGSGQRALFTSVYNFLADCPGKQHHAHDAKSWMEEEPRSNSGAP